ncbi:response regulator transcription factor [Undibacterium fentianense]|uniref:Response regulator transcription factor n=1 Tax=Undibacterium fentianense TaxID=2828728 RepID=A0A941ICZ8_9BURK|nr:LuxR C-terminal-related transcriptional regulator [Undibacterium fentianense]MBR7799413.1 response regulator transcription factor [Undibacterium fentianense]
MLHIVDDEDILRDALSWLARSRQIPSQTYPNAEAFLAKMNQGFDFAKEGDCLLLDVRMAELSGTALFEILSVRRLTQRLPVIFLTGHGDVPMAVDSLKRGAFDFFEKPFNDNALMDRVEQALEQSIKAGEKHQIQLRLESLSQREQEVLERILQGKMNKNIADELGISMRTVEVHRAHIFDKMQIKTAVELAGLLKQ